MQETAILKMVITPSIWTSYRKADGIIGYVVEIGPRTKYVDYTVLLKYGYFKWP